MDAQPQTPPETRRKARWFVWISGVILVLILLLGLTVYFLPQAVSSRIFARYIEREAADVLGLPVRLGRLNWSWSGGIVIEHVDIEDESGFLSPPGPPVTLNRARLVVNWTGIMRRKVAFDLAVEGIHIRLVRRADGKTNLDTLLSAKGPKKTPEKAVGESDWRQLAVALPAEIRGRVRVKDVSLDVEDRLGNHRLTLRNAFIDLKGPLRSGPKPSRFPGGWKGRRTAEPFPPPNSLSKLRISETAAGVSSRPTRLSMLPPTCPVFAWHRTVLSRTWKWRLKRTWIFMNFWL